MATVLPPRTTPSSSSLAFSRTPTSRSDLSAQGVSNTPGNSTGNSTQTETPLNNAPGQADGRNAFGPRLRRILNSNHQATFSATITLHELTNVPTQEDSFTVRWKFRGHALRDADTFLSHPTARRVPTQMISRPSSAQHLSPAPRTLRASPSARSLRSEAAIAAAMSTENGSGQASSSRPAAFKAPHSYHGTPPSLIVPSSAPPASGSRTPPVHGREVEKKQSDPTPLRKSIIRSSSATAEQRGQGRRPIVEEPEEFVVETTAPDDLTEGPSSSARGSEDSQARSRQTSTTDSGMDSASIHSTHSLPIKPRMELGRDTARSATISAMDLARGSKPKGLRSQASQWSLRSDPSLLVAPVVTPPVPQLSSSSSGSLAKGEYSESNRGMMPATKVSSHVVSWEHTIRRVVRIPVGRGLSGKQDTSGRPIHILGDEKGQVGEASMKIEVKLPGDKKSKLAALHYKHRTKNGDGGEGNPLVSYGYVNIDLAPFADKGPTSRRFLLQDSRANATLRITVDLLFLGGDQDWIAPPFSQGHAASVTELMINPEDDDLSLYRRASYSDISDSSSISGAVSVHSLSMTMNSQANGPHHRYKTFDHHLLPEHKMAYRAHRKLTRDPPVGAQPMESPLADIPFVSSPAASPSLGRGLAPLGTNVSISNKSKGYFDQERGGDSPSTASGSLLSPVEAEFTLPTATTTSFSLPPRFRSHDEPAHSLPAELVIEGLFNPEPGDDFTPFTYLEEEAEYYVNGPDPNDPAQDRQAIDLTKDEPEADSSHRERRRHWRLGRRAVSSTRSDHHRW